MSAWVTDEQLAAAKTRGFEPVATIADKNAIDRIRAERNATIAGQQAAERALSANAAGRRGLSAAPGAVRAQRADYFENNVGRFLSIEATTSTAWPPADGGDQPARARWSSPSGTTPPATASAAATSASTTTTGVNPDYYQYHYPVFRVGNKGDGGALPATIKVAAPTATSTRSTSASGSPRTRPRRARASCPAS